MRFMMQVKLPIGRFNEAVRDGTVGEKLHRILEDARPEGAYFAAQDGHRGGFFVVDLKDTSEMAKYAEPWFLNFDAEVSFQPVMTPEDLANAGLDKLAKTWA